TRTDYAAPITPNSYIRQRVSRVTTYEFKNTSLKRVADLLKVPDGSLDLKVIGQTINFYDGDQFVGLPFAEVGTQGALVRTEQLILTEKIQQDAYGVQLPPYFSTGGPVSWTGDYPQLFRQLTPKQAGYQWHASSPFAAGFFVATERRRYDFQSSPSGVGLSTAVRDPLGNDTLITYDQYKALPVSVVDVAGMTTEAEYNYRTFRPRRITDPNGNTAEFRYTPSGLLASSFVKGKSGEGDQVRPSIVMEYGFRAFETSPANAKQPVFVHTTHWEHHDTESTSTAELEKKSERYEYSDGFGRLLQVRVLAEDVLFGNEISGAELIPRDQSIFPGPIVGNKRAPGAPPNVAVSGWQIYNNKAAVIENYEPFFSSGWEYRSPSEELDLFGRKVLDQKTQSFYDPRGHVIRVVNPNGSEKLVIFGTPKNLDKPDQFVPNPWESYTYDANDNAGRTHDLTSSAYKHHRDTPKSIKVDALGRTIESVERNRNKLGEPIAEYRNQMTYDLHGNLLTVTDALGRNAFKHVYDLAKRKLRIESIDAGVRLTVFSATGAILEERSGNGALTLRSYDRLGRPDRVWARDRLGSRITLRERMIYGDDLVEANISLLYAKDKNLLGRLFHHFDEAGKLAFENYDFKGNLLEKSRRVIGNALVLSNTSIDWQPPAAGSLESHSNSLLAPDIYETSIRYDALNRVTLLRYPKDVNNQRLDLKPRYNRAGFLESTTLASSVYVEHIAYDAKGRRTLVVFGNKVLTAYAHDVQDQQVARVWTGRFASSPGIQFAYQPVGQAIQDHSYDYDLSGNILTLKDRALNSGLPTSSNALDRTFDYDALYRLLSASGRECDSPPLLPWDETPRCTDITRTRAYTEEYVYDEVGNIKQIQHKATTGAFTRTFSFVAGNNRLQNMSVGATPYNYAHDDNGNMTSETSSRKLEWDHLNRLRSYQTQAGAGTPSIDAHYLYDVDGRRVKKVVLKNGATVETTIYIDGVFEHKIHAGSENNILHIMDTHSRIAMIRVGNPFQGDSGPAVQYHYGDHLFSSHIVVGGPNSTDSAFINREEYTPYGETSFGSFARKRYRYAGKERDEESGFNYHGARYYAPWLGRWLSSDPLITSSAVGANDVPTSSVRSSLYSGMGNSPVMRVDLDGRQDTGFTLTVRDKTDSSLERAEKRQREHVEMVQKVYNAWKRFKASWNKDLDEKRRETEKEVGPQGHPTPLTNEIINETPAVSGQLWLAFAGSFRGGPRIPIAAQPLSVVARATTIFNKIVSALRNAEGSGANPALVEFLRSGRVAVARVKIAGKTKVYVGVKVPKGTMGADEAVQQFPTKEVGEWVKQNALLDGEELAGVTASRVHAEGVIKKAILNDARAAGVEPATVEGTVGADIDVCHGCQTSWAQELPNVKPENPAP
ncbi:MAG TPA: RHS repeat-associated core domain-containing protein, partial [Pyrinomonadaceae bacterium]